MSDSLKSKVVPYVEATVITVTMGIVFFYIIHPILVDVNPIFAFGSGGQGRGPDSLAEIALIVTVIAGVAIYYSIKYMLSYGWKPFFASIGLTFLIIIPNKFLPEKYHPENIGDLAELENR